MLNKNIQNNAGKVKSSDLYEVYKIFFGTLVSEPRLKIINLLRKSEKNVTEITKAIKLEQTLVSHNLARMKKCGFVICKIKGKYRYYKLNKKTIEPLMNLIDRHISQHCIHILKEKEKKDERR
jgi:DNA-binding transcriptional ArsR family regulator